MWQMRNPSYCGLDTQVVTVWYRAPEILLGSVWPWDSVNQVSFRGLGCARPLAMPRTSTASVWTCGLLAASLRRWQQVELFCDILIAHRVVQTFSEPRRVEILKHVRCWWFRKTWDVSTEQTYLLTSVYFCSCISYFLYPAFTNEK